MPSENIQRATEGNEEPDYYNDDTQEIIDGVDASGLLDNEGKLKANLYNKIDGDFQFINNPGEDKTADVTLEMNNALTEWVVGQLFLGEGGDGIIDMDNPHMAPFINLNHFIITRAPFVASLEKMYNKNVQFLKPKKIYKRGRRPAGQQQRIIDKIVNPSTKRVIKVNKSTYKKLYGSIKLKKVDYKSLSTYDQIDYKIDNNCAVDLLTKYENFNNIEKILNRKVDNDISLDELIKVYEVNNVSIKVYDSMHNVYYKSENEINRTIKIYGDHIYLLSNDEKKKSQTKRIINNVNDIDKYKNNKLVVTDKDLMKNIINKIKETKIMIEYDQYQIPYKSNIILFDPYYHIDKILLKDNDSKCRSVYNMINNKLQLTGHMNIETINYFNKSCKIRFMRSEQQHDILFDENKAYPTQLQKENICFPIPNINDYFEPYDKNKYVKHGLYYCILSTYDDMLGPCDDIYSYYEVEELKKDNRIKEIKYMFVSSESSTMTKEKVEFVKSMNTDRIRAYIGWLLKRQSYDIKKYDIMDNNIDIESLQHFYGDELSINKNYMSVNKIFIKKTTGILANMIIKGLSNIELYKMDKLIKQLNKDIKLVSIRTDSLGYFNNGKEINKPEHLFNSGPGFWKVENKEKKVIKGDYKLVRKIEEPQIKKNIKINEHDENEIEDLINKNKSFVICGKYGTGKTYSIQDKIIPTIKKNKQKYILSSITSENSERIEGETLFNLFNGKSNYEIKTFFEDIDYLIIDEAPLICQEQSIYLDYLKSICKTRIILIGDENQIKNDTFKNKWDTSLFLLNLVDMNKLTMITNHRCDDKTIKLLEQIEKLKLSGLVKFVMQNFKTTKDINLTKFHLCRHKKTELQIIESGDNECSTILSNQGSTINKPYTIHDIKYLPKDQIITSISRSKKWDDIYIYEN